MIRKSVWLLFVLSCLPVASDVVTFHDSMKQAHQDWCDESVPIGPDWCQAIDGRCIQIRMGPDHAPLENTDKINYDRMAACLVPCADDNACPQDQSCREFTTIDGISSRRCVPRTLCRSVADCAQPKYGGHLFSSSCSAMDVPVCRAVGIATDDPESRSCNNDAECVAQYGATATCRLQACEYESNSETSCLANRTFAGQCEHEATNSSGADKLLAHFRDLGVDECPVEGRCNTTRGICKQLSSGIQRCWPKAVNDTCPVGWNKLTVSLQVGDIDLRDVKICVPAVPCLPNGNVFGEDRGRASCPGLENDTCGNGTWLNVLANQAPCEGTESDTTCPDGSSCFAGVCVLEPGQQYSRWLYHSIPTCDLAPAN